MPARDSMLSQEEKETVINFNSVDKTASIYTSQPITPEQMQAISQRPNLLTSRALFLRGKYGDVYMQELMSANTNEAKAAILNKIMELKGRKQ